MPVYQLDPLQDSRWQEFVAWHPKACVFHTVNFLRTLKITYGYEPVVFTTAQPRSQLNNGVVFCRIRSWLTGKRLVSLPFADHCEPLCDHPSELDSILDAAVQDVTESGYRSVEVRPLGGVWENSNSRSFHSGQKYRVHLLDLQPALSDILRRCAKGNVQRRIKHAEKQELVYETASNTNLVDKFYGLMVLTRRRHGTPPPPRSWFLNLMKEMGEKATIRVVSNGKRPIASVLTLTHNGWTTYKYAPSDVRYKHLAAIVLLVWQSIIAAKEHGCHTFDMGRSDLDNPGLIQFKSNWGAQDLPLIYQQYPRKVNEHWAAWTNLKAVGGALLSHLPDPIFVAVGNALYKHSG